jgi:hypothetical protein
MRMQFFKRPLVIKSWLVLLLMAPLVLWLLPADFFDQGLVVCPSRVLFDLECFGCGMTRAVMYLHHLDIDQAVYFNPGVLLVYPALVMVWGRWVYRAWRALYPKPASEPVAAKGHGED